MQVLRPAGLEERRCICRDVLGLYGAIVAVATYTSAEPETESLLRDRIIKALKQCILQQPALSTVILDAETNKPLLARPQTLNLDNHLRFQPPVDTSAGIDAFVEQIQNDSFTDFHLLPAWRLYVRPIGLDSGVFQAAFAMSHALVDGRSCYLFHNGFLAALQRASHSVHVDESPVLGLTASEPLSPPMEPVAKFTISWSFLLGPLIREYSPRFISSLLGSTADIWAGSNIRPARPRPSQLLTTQLRSLVLHRDTVNRAINVCRSHTVRLTAYMNHLIARALALTLQMHGQDHLNFVTDTALDMRRIVPSHSTTMGNLVSSLEEHIALPSEALDPKAPLTEREWADIRTATDRLAHAAESRGDQPVALLKYLDDFWRWTKKSAEKAPETSFSVSNLGAFDQCRTEGWEIREMLFCQSADATGAPFNLNIASVKGGNMAVVISWWPGMLGIVNEDLFVGDVLSRFEALVTAE